MTEIDLAGLLAPPVPATAPSLLVQATVGWLDGLKSVHTVKAYRRDVIGTGSNGEAARMLVPAWLPWCEQQGLNPLDARRGDVNRYAKLINGAGQSKATWARKLSAISSWYDYLLDEDLASRNPAKKATRPHINRDVSQAVGLSEDELNQLLDQAELDGPRTAALVFLLYFGAFRVGSVLAANVGHLGWDSGERTILLTVKGGGDKRIVLEEAASDAVESYLGTRSEPRPDEPLIATASGKRLDEAYCWRLIRRLARRAGIKSWEQLNPHTLRHAHATHALDEKVALNVVQDTLGHIDQRTTLRYDRARQLRKNRSGTVLSNRRRKAREERDAS